MNYARRMLAVLLAVLPSVAMANVLVQKGDLKGMPSVLVVITGNITANDSAELTRQLQDVSSDRFAHRMAFLGSPGGDVGSAMAMGKELRRVGFDAYVPADMQCMSSCIYLLAAGKNKTVMGPVGIHRPYFTETANVAEQYKLLIDESRAYFARLNIPERLADDMFSTPPSDMRILTATELRSYRLDQPDIVDDEIKQLEMAREFGVERSTMVQFNADINAMCTRFKGDALSMRDCMCDVSQSYPEPMQKVACSTRSGAK